MTRRSEPPSSRGSAARPRGAISHTSGTPRSSSATADREVPTRSTIAVRRATLADLPVIVDLRIALLRENANHPVYGRLRADARERAYDVFAAQLRSIQEAMFLAESRDEIVGILRCVETFNSPLLDPDRYCYVSSVYVRPGSRRAGVLRALLRRAESWCLERGLTEMRLHNVPAGSASAAWSATGFRVVEEVRLKVLSVRC
ncbi:MAG TPA: GNAT family N-acetyltransferase [Gemmatimonadaceae bacterium]|nr:GNAT family N-acetyltransferase [Gemmatimonadaceae bacterium]